MATTVRQLELMHRATLHEIITQSLEGGEKNGDKIIGKRQPHDEAVLDLQVLTGLGPLQQVDPTIESPVTENRLRGRAQVRPKRWALKVVYEALEAKMDIHNYISRMGAEFGFSTRQTYEMEIQFFLIDLFTSLGPNVRDGLPTFSTAHTMANAPTQSNRYTYGFGIGELFDMISDTDAQYGENGFPIAIEGGYNFWSGPLVNPYAVTAIKSAGLYDRADRADNKFIQENINEIIKCRYHTQAASGYDDAWGIIPSSKEHNPLRLVEFQAPTTWAKHEDDEDIWKMGVRCNFTLFCRDWLGMAASEGAA